MPLPTNDDRTNILLALWQQGFTVKQASFESGIPYGSVGYYYRRFNNNRHKYKNIIVENVEDQIDLYISKWIKIKKDWLYINDKLEDLIGKDDYAKANELLNFKKSFDKMQTIYVQKMKNLNLQFSSLQDKERIDKFRKKYGLKDFSKSEGNHLSDSELNPFPKNNEQMEINKIYLKLISNKSIADLHK